ncbi:hypothetical protein AMATHDRAFT_65069 [Amanita thiersii Skay4041]|uniref:Uncharacterized protein n=1 Tax=Amanita thiersii Skay4041 TaxID=703135 RepID=A0A2A9NLG3_9AGAR|nr:hypothetical protein AMATHDRAFT_65069 [Amanita thiersii Skay4041]
MDFDPLSDSFPPRYAIESDEEEDEYNPLHVGGANSGDDPQSLSVIIIGDLPKGDQLIVASGDAGKYWANGADLGEQAGSVQANKVEVGLAFRPSWTSAIVIVSEALTRLPVWAQHGYALHILESLTPSRVVLLDSYSAHIYISPKPIPIYDAPVRYLATSSVDPKIGKKAKPFEPPNLLHSTSASFLSILSNTGTTEGISYLLPSRHISPPRPKKILPPDFSHLPENPDEWSIDMMNNIQSLLSLALEEKRSHPWVPRDTKTSGGKAKRRPQVADNGMYI